MIPSSSYADNASDAGVDLTLVVPCYNEAELLDHTVPPLFRALVAAIDRSELILVDNGSVDDTAKVIARLAAMDPRIRQATVAVNEGYGRGVLAGYAEARGRVIGHIPADGPVDPADVAMLASRALEAGPGTLVTAVRLNRQDTWLRRLVSRSYNLVFRILFGQLTNDINGTPKFLDGTDVDRLSLKSEDYFLEAEMMIKARRLGMRTLAIEVPSLMRERGRSKVSARLVTACAEFVRNLVRARFGDLASVDPNPTEPARRRVARRSDQQIPSAVRDDSE